MAFKKYTLTETQLQKLANLCVQEQGTNVNGVKAEASFMANLLETNKSRQEKYGTNGAGLYKWVREGGWFYRSAYFMDGSKVGKKYVDAVRDVLVNGNRTLPQYIDEHDCFSDISYVSTGAIRDRSCYIKDETIIKNKMGSTYTFYCFPSSGSDPFGYTDNAYRYVQSHGESKPETKVNVKAKLPILKRGSQGKSVEVWQAIIGAKVDGDFGPVTQALTVKLQSSNKLDDDGIVGATTWAAGLNSVD